MTPTQLTIKRLKLWGFSCCVVERWIIGANVRKDAFGFGDILACKSSGENRGVWLVQTTSRGHHKDHKDKAEAIPELREWLNSGGRFVIVTWNKRQEMKWEEIKSAKEN